MCNWNLLIKFVLIKSKPCATFSARKCQGYTNHASASVLSKNQQLVMLLEWQFSVKCPWVSKRPWLQYKVGRVEYQKKFKRSKSEDRKFEQNKTAILYTINELSNTRPISHRSTFIAICCHASSSSQIPQLNSRRRTPVTHVNPVSICIPCEERDRLCWAY